MQVFDKTFKAMLFNFFDDFSTLFIGLKHKPVEKESFLDKETKSNIADNLILLEQASKNEQKFLLHIEFQKDYDTKQPDFDKRMYVYNCEITAKYKDYLLLPFAIVLNITPSGFYNVRIGKYSPVRFKYEKIDLKTKQINILLNKEKTKNPFALYLKFLTHFQTKNIDKLSDDGRLDLIYEILKLSKKIEFKNEDDLIKFLDIVRELSIYGLGIMEGAFMADVQELYGKKQFLAKYEKWIKENAQDRINVLEKELSHKEKELSHKEKEIEELKKMLKLKNGNGNGKGKK